MGFYEDIVSSAKTKQQIGNEKARREEEERARFAEDFAHKAFELIKADLIRTAKEEGTEIINDCQTVNSTTVLPAESQKMLKSEFEEYDYVTPNKDPRIIYPAIRHHGRIQTVDIDHDGVFCLFDRKLRELTSQEDISIRYLLWKKETTVEGGSFYDFPYVSKNQTVYHRNMFIAIKSAYVIRPRTL